MKKIALLIFILSFLQVSSQPILNAYDFPATYASIGYTATTANFTNGPSGANVIWDYSATGLNATGVTYAVVPPGTAISASAFPNANFCEKYDYNGSVEYNLYVLNAQTLELIAVSNSVYTTDYSQNSGIVYQFPYIYSSVINDTMLALGSPNPPEPISRTYDSYGTLITPYATYTNVIRQKTVNGLGNATYYWIGTNPYRILMRGNFDNGAGGVSFFPDFRLNNNQIAGNKIFLCPNPTSESFSITGIVAKKLQISVYDVAGKQILQNDVYDSNTEISLKEYAKGIYLIKVTDIDGNSSFTEKIVKN